MRNRKQDQQQKTTTNNNDNNGDGHDISGDEGNRNGGPGRDRGHWEHTDLIRPRTMSPPFDNNPTRCLPFTSISVYDPFT